MRVSSGSPRYTGLGKFHANCYASALLSTMGFPKLLQWKGLGPCVRYLRGSSHPRASREGSFQGYTAIRMPHGDCLAWRRKGKGFLLSFVLLLRVRMVTCLAPCHAVRCALSLGRLSYGDQRRQRAERSAWGLPSRCNGLAKGVRGRKRWLRQLRC